jgi:hypothetical protein
MVMRALAGGAIWMTVALAIVSCGGAWERPAVCLNLDVTAAAHGKIRAIAGEIAKTYHLKYTDISDELGSGANLLVQLDGDHVQVIANHTSTPSVPKNIPPPDPIPASICFYGEASNPKLTELVNDISSALRKASISFTTAGLNGPTTH